MFKDCIWSADRRNIGYIILSFLRNNYYLKFRDKET